MGESPASKGGAGGVHGGSLGATPLPEGDVEETLVTHRLVPSVSWLLEHACRLCGCRCHLWFFLRHRFLEEFLAVSVCALYPSSSQWSVLVLADA